MNKNQVFAINQASYNSTIDAKYPIISVQDLYKQYDKLVAVRGIKFEVERGEIFGLIGPDGAGKTTTFHILGGVMEATAGNVKILNRSPRDARLGIGYLTQQFSLYLDLSIDENLRYSAGLRQVPEKRFQERRIKYLRLMNLEKFSHRLAGQLSGGMKQKLALCCALISQPEVLLLDEPTTGVDPVSRREFWDVLAELSKEGMTIVVATPYLDEAERCDRIALMYDGQIHQIGTLPELRSSLGLHRLELRTNNLQLTEELLLETIKTGFTGISASIIDVQTFGDRLDVLVKNIKTDTTYIKSILEVHNIQARIENTEATLENVFVTRLRQQGSEPSFIPFPRSRNYSSRKLDEKNIAIGAKNIWKFYFKG
jgi:ABC-2 type transport system ATP-binding protein